MKLQQVARQMLKSRGGYSYNCIFETPSGIKVAKTKYGYFPTTRDGQINKKRRFVGKINDYEIWEHTGKGRVSITLRET